MISINPDSNIFFHFRFHVSPETPWLKEITVLLKPSLASGPFKNKIDHSSSKTVSFINEELSFSVFHVRNTLLLKINL